MGTRELIVCFQVLLVIIVKRWLVGTRELIVCLQVLLVIIVKVVAGGNQGANSLPPSFTCHYCKGSGWWEPGS